MQETTKRKEMTEAEFDRIKAFQARHPLPKDAAPKTGWSVETVRLVFKYATWPAYRRKIVAKRRAEATKRLDARMEAKASAPVADQMIDDTPVLTHSGLYPSRGEKIYASLAKLAARAYTKVTNLRSK